MVLALTIPVQIQSVTDRRTEMAKLKSQKVITIKFTIRQKKTKKKKKKKNRCTSTDHDVTMTCFLWLSVHIKHAKNNSANMRVVGCLRFTPKTPKSMGG